ncbi:MAG TPA: hypothetical protein VHY35_02305 [Stellaceae bacterium]|nr:hypothetical protein [Stellaceae bacterium]
MFAPSSKYSLALYEMIQKRGNMNRACEDLRIEDFHGFLDRRDEVERVVMQRHFPLECFGSNSSNSWYFPRVRPRSRWGWFDEL